MLLRRQGARNGHQTLPQFLPVAPIASVAKRAESLEAVGLTDHRPGPHHLSAAAAPDSQQHRRHPTGAEPRAALLSVARRIGEPLCNQA
jgi:hypothetical protein